MDQWKIGAKQPDEADKEIAESFVKLSMQYFINFVDVKLLRIPSNYLCLLFPLVVRLMQKIPSTARQIHC